MADIKISEMGSGGPAQSLDQIEINRAGVTGKLTAEEIAVLAETVLNAITLVGLQIVINADGSASFAGAKFVIDADGSAGPNAGGFKVVRMAADGSLTVGSGDAAIAGTFELLDAAGTARLTIGTDGKITINDAAGNSMSVINGAGGASFGQGSTIIGDNGGLNVNGGQVDISSGGNLSLAGDFSVDGQPGIDQNVSTAVPATLHFVKGVLVSVT